MTLSTNYLNQVLSVILAVFTAQGYVGKVYGRSHFIEVNVDGVVFGLKYMLARKRVEYYALRPDGTKSFAIGLKLMDVLSKEFICFYDIYEGNSVATSLEVMQWDVETEASTREYAMRLLSVFQRVATECAVNSEV